MAIWRAACGKRCRCPIFFLYSLRCRRRCSVGRHPFCVKLSDPPMSEQDGPAGAQVCASIASHWCFRAAARSAPIRSASSRRWRKPGSARNGSPAPPSARSTPRSWPAMPRARFGGKLTEFWDQISRPDGWAVAPVGDEGRHAANQWHAWETLVYGQPGFFQPRLFGPFLVAAGHARRDQFLRYGAAGRDSRPGGRFRPDQQRRLAADPGRGQHRDRAGRSISTARARPSMPAM